MGDANNSIWNPPTQGQEILNNGIPSGDFIPPVELVSAPRRQAGGRALLWALTLLSFLGGAFYGYSFRKSANAMGASVVVVEDGHSLVAQWDPKQPELSQLNRAELRINTGAEKRLVPLDKPALRRGRLTLGIPALQSADIELAGEGVSGRARFVAGDPLDVALAYADADSLRQQIADQKQLNQQMESRLADGTR